MLVCEKRSEKKEIEESFMIDLPRALTHPQILKCGLKNILALYITVVGSGVEGGFN